MGLEQKLEDFFKMSKFQICVQNFKTNPVVTALIYPSAEAKYMDGSSLP